MTRRALALLSLLLLAPSLEAQTTRRPLPRGDVQGVELGLEGSLQVPRATTATWLLTAYEVLGVDRLRPAPGARIVVTSAVQPGEPVAELEADERGRATVQIPIPEDAPAAVPVTISVHSRRGVQRRFELAVQTHHDRSLRVFLAPPAPEEPVVAVGRLTTLTGVGIAEAEVELVFADSRGPVAAPVRVRTNPAGLFVGSVVPPVDLAGAVQVRAFHGAAEERIAASDSAGLEGVVSADLLVQIAPASRVAAPQAAVPVEVVVRRPDGMPVAGARVALGSRVPRPLSGTAVEPDPDQVLTDERGRARLVWNAPRLSQPYRDVHVTVAAGHPAHGRGVGNATVRVSRVAHQAAVSVAGGALTPELGGRLFVRVARIDGSAAGDVGVALAGPRIGEHQQPTDAGGVAAFDVPLRDAADDRCGGSASASITVTVDGVASPLCVPVEVDGSARVSLPTLVAPGDPVEVRIERTRRAARLPVVVQVEGAFTASVVADPRQDSVQIPIPPGARGLIQVRGRPLVDGREVYGGSAVAWVAPLAGGDVLEEPLRLAAEARGAAIRASVEGSEAARAAVIAVPLDAMASLRARLQGDSPFEQLRGAPTEPALAAVLATRATRDVTVPSVYRERCEGSRRPCVVPMPAPQNAAARGLLRDPWRASDRFVEGRLALVFRALENRVAAAVPGNLDSVSHLERGRRVLDDHVLASLPEHQLGGEGATGLGGEPLTMAMLRRIDPSFRFDAIAERITRERLFVLLLALRDFVNQRGLDLPWARPGDPSLWLRQIVGHQAGGRYIQARDLVDGWGRPFELRPTGRARFQQLQPVAGHEVISAGPDGRAGNGNDVYDPTARVLRSGSIYGRAVGEDALLARLNGVELGRATLDLAAAIHGQPGPAIRPPDEAQARVDLGRLPPVLQIPPDPLALRRPAIPAGPAAAEGRAVALDVGEEPRTWGVLAWVVDGTGRERLLETALRGGAPAFVTPELARDLGEDIGPDLVRIGEPLTWPLRVVNATEGPLELRLEARASGLELDTPSALSIDPETGARVDVVFRGRTPGRARWALHSGEVVVARGRVTVDRGLHPLRRRSAGLAMGRWHGEMGAPEGARHPRTRVVLLGRGGLGADPDLAEARRDEAALLGWHAAMVGRPLDDELAARVERAGGSTGRVPALSMAGTLVSLAATLEAEDERSRARDLVRQLAQQLPGRFAMGALDDERFGELAAVVVALATSAVTPGRERVWPMEGEAIVPRPGAVDPISTFVAQARVALRRALAERTDRPALQARAAAALLLIDARDGHGRAMVERLRESDSLRRMGLGGEDPEDAFEGTLALALAAHQVGDDDLAERMARGAAAHSSFAARARGAALFWWLALDAYGVLGAAPPATVTVEIDGEDHSVPLEAGVGVLDLGERTVDDVVIESEIPIFARAETLYARPFAGAAEAPLAVALEGRLGAVGAPAGYEIQVSARAEVGTPVVDIQLPASAVVDDTFLRTIQAASPVRRVEAREPGFLRVHLVRLRRDQAVTFPLPFVRISPSPVKALGIVAYSATRPGVMTTLAPRTVGD